MEQQTHRLSSIWQTTADTPRYPPLMVPTSTSVCIVGAGIAGLTTAYVLTQAGIPVVVLDDGPVGGGESGRTTAHLTCILDKGYAETIRLRGIEGARLAAASHQRAIDMIEQIVAAEQIDCDFTRLDGYLFLEPSEDAATLDYELSAARRAGLLHVERVDRVPLIDGPPYPALRFPNQGQFHVLRYLSGLCRAIERQGGKIYCDTRVSKVSGGTITQVTTESGLDIAADATVLATNAPINDALGYSSRVFPYRTYVIGLQIPKGSVPPLLLYDTCDPYHYVRIQPGVDHDTLIVGGEDHHTGRPDQSYDPFGALEGWARSYFPLAGAVTHRWSGQVLNSFDGLGLIGRDLVDEHVFVITGDTGFGMTHGTLGGILVADLIAGRPNPWAELYDPGRLTMKAVGEVISAGAGTVAQARDWVSGGEVSGVEAIPADSGALIGWGLGKAAVYRDPQGALHYHLAACKHTGCIVTWNDREKTWDCPCHGSRYDAYGRVINGPASADLDPAKPPQAS